MHLTPENESVMLEIMDIEYLREDIIKNHLPYVKTQKRAKELNIEIAYLTMKELRLLPKLKLLSK